MPMPKPKPKETASAFISRFVKNKRMKAEFPNIKQRLAVAYALLRKHKRRRKK